ncbi:hypothetical protein Tco_0851971, partial [Tanacetum coccineum]
GAYCKEHPWSWILKKAKESNILDLCGYLAKHSLLQSIHCFSFRSIPAIYIQQFLNTLEYDAKTDNRQNTFDHHNKFVSPPSGDAIMDFVNELGYTEARLLDMIGPYTQFFRCFGGIITSSIVDYVKLMWEEFVQAIQTFLTNKANLGSPTKKSRKDKAHVIPYCRFTKLIICHLGRTHNIHQRSASPFHLAEEDLRLGNLKFVPKGEEDEVFGMPIPNELISNNIRNAPYYNAYLEMVAKHDRKIAAEKAEKKKPATAKQPKPKPAKEKSSKPAPAPKPKVTKEKSSKPSPAKHPKRGKVQKLRKGKPSLQLIDEDEPTQPEPEPELEHQGEGDEYDVERAIQMSRESISGTKVKHMFGGRTPATEEASTGPSTQPQDDTSANIVRDSLSPVDAETGADTDRTNSGGDTEILQFGDEQGDDVMAEVNLKDKTAEIDEGQARSDPGKTPESRPPPDDNKMDEDQAGPDTRESHVALAGPDPEPTHDEFIANVYPKVHESLKFPADEHVILEDPPSSTGTLSSMKNLEDAYTIGDQFFNDKSTEDEPGKLNVEAEVVSMVTVPIYQASSSVPPMSTPVIDLSPPKLTPSTTQAPVFTATTSTTTTTHPLPPLPQQQSITDSELAARVTTLKQKFAAFEQKSKTLDYTTQNLGSRKTTDTRDAPSSSSKQQSNPYSEQSIEDIPMPDTTNISYSEETSSAHLLKIKPRLEWLKPIPEYWDAYDFLWIRMHMTFYSKKTTP